MKVLFVCIHNSARSQMAEELLRKFGGEKFHAESAGLEPGTLNPVVVDVLNKEEGIDISGKSTQAVSDLVSQNKIYDYVITVCDEASAEQCPVFPGGAKRLHWGFEDPSAFSGNEKDKYQRAALIKDLIKESVQAFIKETQ